MVEKRGYPIRVSYETIQLIKTAKRLFLVHHPDLKDIPLSQDRVIRQALTYYIEH